MKKLTNAIGILIFLIIGLGFWIETTDPIPDNAQVRLMPLKHLWIPNDAYNKEKIDNSIHTGEFSMDDVAQSVPTTYLEMKKNDETKQYTIPQSWKTYSDTYQTSKSHSVLMSFVATKRWNADGTWNY